MTFCRRLWTRCANLREPFYVRHREPERRPVFPVPYWMPDSRERGKSSSYSRDALRPERVDLHRATALLARRHSEEAILQNQAGGIPRAKAAAIVALGKGHGKTIDSEFAFEFQHMSFRATGLC